MRTPGSNLARVLFALLISCHAFVGAPFNGGVRAGDNEAPKGEEPVDGLREFVDKALKAWKVPGVSIAVVHNDKVLYSDGFGTRDIHGGAPVTAKTLFGIGSSSKAFTALALAILADDGKVDLDEPVRKYLPDFRLKDPFATEHTTPRDLLTHRSGLPRHDLLWYGSSFTRRELFQRLRELEPTKSFRSKFQYQNLMYMTAGYLVGQVTESTWENFVKTRIFDPLGMTHSVFTIQDSQRVEDHAKPHGVERNKPVAIPYRPIAAIGPAGSIQSNAVDMARWVRFQLGDGKVGDGKAGDQRILSKDRLQDLHTPHMVLGVPPKGPEFFHASYALGWMVEPYRGHLRIHHGGNIDGFSALVTFLPRDGIGIVVLANSNATPIPDIISFYVIDRLLKLKPVDWNLRLSAQQFAVRRTLNQAKASAKNDPSRKQGTQTSHPLGDFVGDYEHAGYGVVRIRKKDKKLTFACNGVSGDLEHFHYDVFQVRGEHIGGLKLTFRLGTNGNVDGLEVALEPTAPAMTFRRKLDTLFSTARYLRRFTGGYSVAGQKGQVKINGRNELVIAMPGQPVWTLDPVEKNVFKIRELSGYTLRFQSDEDDWTSGIQFVQPNGVFQGKRVDPKELEF